MEISHTKAPSYKDAQREECSMNEEMVFVMDDTVMVLDITHYTQKDRKFNTDYTDLYGLTRIKVNGEVFFFIPHSLLKKRSH